MVFLLNGALVAPAAHAQQLLPPQFTSTPATSALVGQSYSYAITVSDLDLLDTIAISAAALPSWLTLTDHGDRTATLDGTPAPGDIGPYTILLEASDGQNIAQQSFTLTVSATQVLAADDAYSAEEDKRLDVKRDSGVLANDPGDGGDPKRLQAVLETNVTSGTLELRNDGSFRYDPSPNFSGTDVFTYRAVADSGSSEPATVTIDVTPTNDTPVGTPDSYATAQDTQLTVDAATGVLANDSDSDGDPLTVRLTRDVGHGTLALAGDGSFVYSPNPGFSGADDFRYRASDGMSESGEVTVAITVSAGNGPPTAVDDSYSTSGGAALVVGAGEGVLSNDTDPENDPLTASLVTNVSSGTLQLSSDGSFSYTANLGFAGTDSFTYTASDGSAPSNSATVIIAVAAGNTAPVANADSYTTAEGATLTISAATGVLGNDTDAEADHLTAVLVGSATSGVLTLNADGSFTYAPAAGFSGTDTFSYRANDGTADSNTASVTIMVSPVNGAPVAIADAYTTMEDVPLSVPAATGVLGNDQDPDGGPSALTAVLRTNVSTGTLTLNANGSFEFAPPANFNGLATFSYAASDGTATSDPATVTITVSPVNDAPFITSAPRTSVEQGASYSYTLMASDPDGDALAFGAPTLPAWLAFQPPATIAGTPSQADVGSHPVRMTVTDGLSPPIVQDFSIVVGAVDNAPRVASIPAQTATEGEPFTFEVAPFVSDPDTPVTQLRYLASGALPAGFVLSSTGTLSGTPPLDGAGDYTVHFTVADGTTTVDGQFALQVLRAGRTDLAITVSAAPNPVQVAMTATWTLSVANSSNVDVGLAAVEATFTGGAPFRFDTPPPACTVAPGADSEIVRCTLGPIAGGSSTSVKLTGSGSLAGDVFASATVSVEGPVPVDDTPANDRSTASLSIAQQITGEAEQTITGFAARAAAAGDFDGDGFDDLALATSSSGGTLVLMNVADPANPNKRMLSTSPLALGGGALGTDVAVADLDSDGHLDLVVAAGAGAPSRELLSSGGTFTAVPLGPATADGRAIATGDLNGDQFVDLVIAQPGGSALYLNQGSGGAFAAAGLIGSGDARGVAIADLFGDPLPEIVIANGDRDAEIYRLANGVPQLAVTLPTGPTRTVAVADFNGDGRQDLVFGRASAASGAPADLVMLNTSGTSASFFRSDSLGATPTTDLLVADIDLDGDTDVLTVGPAGAQLYTNVGLGTGTFALHPAQLETAGATSVVAGRFGADERIDVAIVANGDVRVFYNDGAGNLGQGDTAGPTIQLIGTPEVALAVGAAYNDSGATATDAVDGDVTSRITVDNPVDTAVIGSYTVTYSATDTSGNAATPVTRTVRVNASNNAEGGGGGALGLEALLLAIALALRARARAAARRPPTRRRT